VRRRRTTCLSLSACVVLAGAPRDALAQACCAGSGALTPGRLALHEDALVGTELHGSVVVGEYGATPSHVGQYTALPGGQGEGDFEQDLFGAVRLFKRGQVALLLPFVETYRKGNDAEGFGGGIGDMNLSARYDFVRAGESRYVPGIAALAGITAPTGRPPTSPIAGTLAVDSTGTGAWQGNFGLALEQSFGHWLFDASEIFAWRAPFSAQGVEDALAPQWTTLIGGGYVFDNQAAVALFGSYTYEGDPSINGFTLANSSRQLVLLGISGVYPVLERLRLQSSLFFNPPLSGFGAGQTAAVGLTFTVIGSWI
jgi:hypothetical protein